MFTDADRVWVLLGKKKSGEASLPELRELAALLEADGITSQVIDELWDARMQQVNEPDMGAAGWNRILRKINSAGSDKIIYRSDRSRWLIAACFFILAGCFTAYYFQPVYKERQAQLLPAKRDNQFVTQAGSKSTLQLPDGTRVWLNANSQLSYGHEAFGVQLREIYLSGEAFFDVVKNEKVPFLVHSGPVTITVMGTAFNVKAYPGEKTVETSLVRGLIEITTRHDPERKIIVKPDEKIVIPVDESTAEAGKSQTPSRAVYFITALQRGRSNVLPETVWLQSKLEFDDEPFSELGPKMQEWFNISIVFADEEIRAKRFTGMIEKETLKETLKAMQLSYPFTYELKGTQLTISTSKQNHYSP